MTVVVLQHVPDEGPGLIADALARADRTFRTVRLFAGDPVPLGPDGVEGLVVMGGPMGVGDVERHPHLLAEKDLIADCLDARVPVLGICLGAQLLASTLGAEVRRGRSLELGWLPVSLTPHADRDPLMAGLPSRFEPLHWHSDVFDLPPGAVHLASSQQTPVQAFRYAESAYGLLFHLEVTREQVQAMARAFPDDVAGAGLEQPDLLGAAALDGVAPLADPVFDAWTRLLP